MAKQAKQMTADDYMGKQAMFIVPVRCEGDTSFRVKVKIKGVRKKFGRTDLNIVPTAGDGEAWVSAESVEDVK